MSTLNVLRLLSDQAAIQHLSKDMEGVGFVSAPSLVVVVVVVNMVGGRGPVGRGTTCLFRRLPFVKGGTTSSSIVGSVVVMVVVVIVDVVVVITVVVVTVVVNPGCQVESHVVVQPVVVVAEVVGVKC